MQDNIIPKLLISILLALSLTACAVQATPRTGTTANPGAGEIRRLQDFQKDYTKQVKNPPRFDPKRTEFTCAAWSEPEAPDEASARWYRAATTIDAKRFRLSPEEYQKMLILYEGAARKGHYKAIKNLIVRYNEGGSAMGGDEFLPEPENARYWLHYGLNKGWAGAFEWLSNALHYGNAGYARDEQLSAAYLQKAADLGVPFAQYELAEIYGEIYVRREVKIALLQCAAAQDFSPALNLLAIEKEIYGYAQEALDLYQRAVMAGGVRGGASALTLRQAFTEGELAYRAFTERALDHDELTIPIDTERAKAYKELETAFDGTETTSGNIFLRFPRLNEVLPLPPAKMPRWKGIYSAMSPEDAEYYQNPTNPDDLIKEIKEAGMMIPEGYLSRPILFKDNPRFNTVAPVDNTVADQP